MMDGSGCRDQGWGLKGPSGVAGRPEEIGAISYARGTPAGGGGQYAAWPAGTPPGEAGGGQPQIPHSQP